MRFFLFRGILIWKFPFPKPFVSNAYLNRRKFTLIPCDIFWNSFSQFMPTTIKKEIFKNARQDLANAGKRLPGDIRLLINQKRKHVA